MLGKTRDELRNVRIEFARILFVDVENMTVDLRTEHSETPYYRVPIMNPGCNQQNGAIFQYVPAVGTTCIVGFLSDDTKCVMGFLPVQEGNGSFRAGLQNANPGDFVWQGDNGNYIALRANGMLEMFGTNICGMVCIPIRNILNMICENLVVDCFAGELEFITNRKEDSSDGKAPTEFSLNVKQFSNDENELVRLRMGNVDGDKLAFNLIIKDKGSDENIKINIKMNTDGSVESEVTSGYKIKIKGAFNLNCDDNISIEGKKDIKIKGNQTTTIEGNTLNMNANTMATIKSNSTTINSTTVTISNSAAFPVMRLTPEVAAVLNAAAAVANLTLPPTYFNNNVKV